MEQPIAYQVLSRTPFDQAIEEVTAALKQEGFGVLTTIDVQSTLKERLGEEMRRYVILGACNPPLAHRALNADARVGVLLPCNVTIEELDDETLISLANPLSMLIVGSLAENPAMRAVAEEANARMENVASRLDNLSLGELPGGQ